MITFWVLEVEDGVIVPEEVDLIDAEGMRAHLLDNGLHDLVASGLHKSTLTATLLTTFTFLRCEPFPPVLASPTLFLNFSILA